MSIRPRLSLLNPELLRPHALDASPRDPKCIWLDKNENLDPVLMALSREVLLSLPSLTVPSYPEAGATYRKLAQWVGVDPESLLLTPGSDGVIRRVFEAFVEPDDEVIHTLPTFAMYAVYGQMFGAKVHIVQYQSRDGRPWLDPDRLFSLLRVHKPKLLCLPNPDSPTGARLPAEVLRALLSECEATATVLLLDEAYHPFLEWSAVSWTAESRNLIVARTFAKAWGAAGLRIGYSVAHPETTALLHKLRPMYEVSTIAIDFMSRMLDNAAAMQESVDRCREGKAFFVKEMRSLGYHVLPTAGNFVHVAFGRDGEKVHQSLSGKVLYRVSFGHPCLAGYSRFTVGPKAIMAKVVELIHMADRA